MPSVLSLEHTTSGHWPWSVHNYGSGAIPLGGWSPQSPLICAGFVIQSIQLNLAVAVASSGGRPWVDRAHRQSINSSEQALRHDFTSKPVSASPKHCPPHPRLHLCAHPDTTLVHIDPCEAERGGSWLWSAGTVSTTWDFIERQAGHISARSPPAVKNIDPIWLKQLRTWVLKVVPVWWLPLLCALCLSLGWYSVCRLWDCPPLHGNFVPRIIIPKACKSVCEIYLFHPLFRHRQSWNKIAHGKSDVLGWGEGKVSQWLSHALGTDLLLHCTASYFALESGALCGGPVGLDRMRTWPSVCHVHDGSKHFPPISLCVWGGDGRIKSWQILWLLLVTSLLPD